MTAFRSDMTVELVQSVGSDATVVAAARVSTIGELSRADVDGDPAEAVGLINFLMRDRHGTPFEQNLATFYISAPIFVFREFMRHRIASYNEESGRYRELKPVFYLPAADRPLVQQGKAGAYEFVAGTTDQHTLMDTEIRRACTTAYESYQKMLRAGIAREVARAVLPVTTYSTMYVSMNARSLMNFLSLRTTHPESAYPSFPQREIEMVAEQMETLWAAQMPITHAAFQRHGRVCP